MFSHPHQGETFNPPTYINNILTISKPTSGHTSRMPNLSLSPPLFIHQIRPGQTPAIVTNDPGRHRNIQTHYQPLAGFEPWSLSDITHRTKSKSTNHPTLHIQASINVITNCGKMSALENRDRHLCSCGYEVERWGGFEGAISSPNRWIKRMGSMGSLRVFPIGCTYLLLFQIRVRYHCHPFIGYTRREIVHIP